MTILLLLLFSSVFIDSQEQMAAFHAKRDQEMVNFCTLFGSNLI